MGRVLVSQSLTKQDTNYLLVFQGHRLKLRICNQKLNCMTLGAPWWPWGKSAGHELQYPWFMSGC